MTQREVRLVGVHVEHQRGKSSRVFLTIDRGLKSGLLDEVPLTRNQLARLVAESANYLRVLLEQER